MLAALGEHCSTLIKYILNTYTQQWLALDEHILYQQGSYTEEWQSFMWCYA